MIQQIIHEHTLHVYRENNNKKIPSPFARFIHNFSSWWWRLRQGKKKGEETRVGKSCVLCDKKNLFSFWVVKIIFRLSPTFSIDRNFHPPEKSLVSLRIILRSPFFFLRDVLNIFHLCNFPPRHFRFMPQHSPPSTKVSFKYVETWTHNVYVQESNVNTNVYYVFENEW